MCLEDTLSRADDQGMKQSQFESTFGPFWEQFDRAIENYRGQRPRSRRTDNRGKVPAHRFAIGYRRVCHHFSLARQRRYSTYLIGRLHDLVLRGHDQLYRRQAARGWGLLRFLWIGFPKAVQRHRVAVVTACALFYGPAFTMGWLGLRDSEIVYSIIPEGALVEIEQMYDPANSVIGRPEGRQSDTDLMMFGYYIFNNISIGFKTFASGLLLAVGPIVALVYNGAFIGTIAGHLTRIGFTSTFWPFVVGHSALELTAIVICGAAGLVLARPLVAPGRYRRVDALRIAGRESIELTGGAAIMLLGAALVEAFWSPLAISNSFKYALAVTLWVVVIGYFVVMRR